MCIFKMTCQMESIVHILKCYVAFIIYNIIMISHNAATVYMIENVVLSAYCAFPLFVSPNGRHGFCYSFLLLFSKENFGIMKYSHSFPYRGAHSLRSLSFHLPLSKLPHEGWKMISTFGFISLVTTVTL